MSSAENQSGQTRQVSHVKSHTENSQSLESLNGRVTVTCQAPAVITTHYGFSVHTQVLV